MVNQFFVRKQDRIQEVLSGLRFDEPLSHVRYCTSEDSLVAERVMLQFRDSIAGIKQIQTETRLYSALYILLMVLIGSLIFVIAFFYITKPLKQLIRATTKIRAGDFSVYLPETGFSEVRLLKQSFNEMSRELENIQKRLLLTEKEMIWKELSRILAHEIKNPLTPIQLELQRLEEKYETDRERFVAIFPESVQIIDQEIQNLRDLVQTFSTFAKTATPNFSIFDPAENIQDILKPYQHQYKITTDLSGGRNVRFDPQHFYQIFTNILQNAIDVTPPDGSIDIRLIPSRSYLVLEVSDHGPGIEPADLTRIFEPYFTRKSRGTGLGLALVKRLTEANHAVIRVKSKVGPGTQFEVIMEVTNERPDRG
jgi:nitrogen fixation/metabolism regulation signal transduction histidine kinase